MSPEAVLAGGASGGVGLYARVSSHDQKADLDRQVARLSTWAAQAGLGVVRVEAEVGSGMNGARAKVRRLLAGPKVTVVVDRWYPSSKTCHHCQAAQDIGWAGEIVNTCG
jgi:putative resolvase